MTQPPRDYTTTFRLSREQHARLCAAARAAGVPYSKLIRRGIDLAIADLREKTMMPSEKKQ